VKHAAAVTVKFGGAVQRFFGSHIGTARAGHVSMGLLSCFSASASFALRGGTRVSTASASSPTRGSLALDVLPRLVLVCGKNTPGIGDLYTSTNEQRNCCRNSRWEWTCWCTGAHQALSTVTRLLGFTFICLSLFSRPLIRGGYMAVAGVSCFNGPAVYGLTRGSSCANREAKTGNYGPCRR
jgi:hypothetical protein